MDWRHVRGRYEGRRQRGDARKVAEEVQRRPLGREDGPQRSGHFHDGDPGRQMVAVLKAPVQHETGVELAKGLGRAVPPRQHPALAERAAQSEPASTAVPARR